MVSEMGRTVGTLGRGEEKMDPAPFPGFLAAEAPIWVKGKVSPLNLIPRIDYYTRLNILTFYLRLYWRLKVSIGTFYFVTYFF